jgi:hypothetical protein
MTVINPIPINASILGAGPDTGQNDLIPALHLSRWATPGVKVVDIIGDSTGTELPGANYAWDATQTIWGALKAEIMRRNPQLKFNFNNRAIASTNWANPVMTANDRGDATAAPVPDWFTNRDKVWLDYVRDDQPDTLFWVMGTNAPQSGQTAGSSVASFINDSFTRINGWVKVPDIVICTTKIGNQAYGPPADTTQEAYKAMAAFLRTFARSNRNGYATFPRIKYIGLIDLGRQYAARALGKDLAHQYMSRVPAAIRTGLTLAGPYPGTVNVLGTTTDGDLSLSLLFHNAGGTNMYNAIGLAGLFITISGYFSNRIHVTMQATGVWVTRYQLMGVDTDPVITGANYSPPTGDVTMSITLKGERIIVTLNGNSIIDTSAPRLIQNCVVSIGAGSTPSSAITFDVTEFLEGIGSPALQTLNPATAFGGLGGGLIAGNDVNHPSSTTVALIDYATIAASNLAAPMPTAAQLKDDKMQIYVDMTSTPNTAITTEEILKTAPILANQFQNVGDTLEIEAWGIMAATTDNKTVRLRWGGIGGASLVSPNTALTTGIRWRILGTIVKSAANVQQTSGQGTISTTNYAVSSGAGGQADAAATTLVVTSQNATTAAAASITCDGFRVSYIKAPGT